MEHIDHTLHKPTNLVTAIELFNIVNCKVIFYEDLAFFYYERYSFLITLPK